MNKNKLNKITPKYRFPEYCKNKDWEKIKFKKHIKLYRGSSPRPIQDFLTISNGVNWIKIGDTKNSKNYFIDSVEEQITKDGAKQSRSVKKGEIILANSMSYGSAYELGIDGCIYDGWFVLREYEKSFNKNFLMYQLNSNLLKYQYERLSAGGIVKNISSDIVYATNLLYTGKEEQKKIAECLKSIDDLIVAEETKLEQLKAHKKGLLQKLLPQQNEKSPKLRFKNFKQEWQKTTFDSLLDYERPDKYIVLDTNYKSDGTPVLTANKAFILGYTSEKKGIYNNLPAIIFDDFTTDKKFVDFPFKVKSSAIKILKPKAPNNLKFIFELMNNTIFISTEHKRYYISTYKNIELYVTLDAHEQQKIADCLSSIDELMSAQSEKIEALKQHKKGLMQGLFPFIKEVDND